MCSEREMRAGDFATKPFAGKMHLAPDHRGLQIICSWFWRQKMELAIGRVISTQYVPTFISTMILLPRQSSLADLESLIFKIRQSPSQDLRLPIQVSRGGAFAFQALAVQAVATWARLHEGIRQLQLSPSFSEDETTRERLGGGLLGMCSLYFADQVKSGETVLSRASALEAVAPRVFAMNEYRYHDTVRGRNAALCCFEGAKLEFVRSLYAIPRRGSAEDTTVRSVSQFKDILVGMLEACSSGASRSLTPSQLEVLASLVHQLFKNADVHTQTDARGSIYENGVRGIQVREVVISDEEAFDDFVSDDRALHAYLTKLGNRGVVRRSGEHGKEARLTEWKSQAFVEITVFDTGPGLALRWLSSKSGAMSYADVSRDDELEAVKACFSLHTTTHSSTTRGDGLAIAMDAMKELSAFMFLRTGRMALYQDFSSKEHVGFKPQLRYGGKKQLGEVAGASYSICFPLMR